MSNLIIAVIAIALTAVAALMGVYYGGNAFIDGQAKSQANALVQGAEQVAGAWQIYAANTGSNNLTDYNWFDGTATDLVPNYLSTIPNYAFASNVAGLQYYPYLMRFFSNTVAGNASVGISSGGILTVSFLGISAKTCQAVNLMATGTATLPTSEWLGYTQTATATAELQPFRCVGRLVSSVLYYNFIYRVF